jgi:30S ribosomal protein S31
MGKGDKKTKKGKRFKGSFGKSRPRNNKKNAAKKKAQEK